MAKELTRKLSGSYIGKDDEETTSNLKALMERAKKEERKYCDRCMGCFNEDEGSFHLEPILKCKRVSRIFKDFYQLKSDGVYRAEQPFMVDLKAMPRES